jgi:cytochrome c553
MTVRVALPFLLAAAVALPVVARAEGSAAAGKKKAMVCFACHGANGNSTDPQYPRLAGQYPGYIVQALREYKDGQRKNPIMRGFASQLTEQDREDIAAYFHSLPPVLYNLKGDIQGSGKGL